jgi:metal transporter CNNM
MGLDELHLRVLATSSDDMTERANAKKGTLSRLDQLVVTEEETVLQLMSKGRHWILVVSCLSVLLCRNAQ